jgi:hypothetical protein
LSRALSSGPGGIHPTFGLYYTAENLMRDIDQRWRRRNGIKCKDFAGINSDHANNRVHDADERPRG